MIDHPKFYFKFTKDFPIQNLLGIYRFLPISIKSVFILNEIVLSDR